MFAGKKNQVTAVRRKNGAIDFYELPKKEYKILKILNKVPFVRGLSSIIESAALGSKHFNFSADCFDVDPDNPEEAELSQPGKVAMVIGVAAAGVLAFFLGNFIFTVVPMFLAAALMPIFPGHVAQVLLEGFFNVLLLVIYMLIIAQTPIIKRIFQYHGAEHKLINTHEAGEDLTVENIKRHSKLHYRCGSSFMIFTVFVSIVLYLFFPTDDLAVRLMSRIILIPVVIGVSYEVLKIANAARNNKMLRFISYPGLWLQGLTTKEPTDEQIEVAILSFNRLIEIEEGQTAEQVDLSEVADASI